MYIHNFSRALSIFSQTLSLILSLIPCLYKVIKCAFLFHDCFLPSLIQQGVNTEFVLVYEGVQCSSHSCDHHLPVLINSQTLLLSQKILQSQIIFESAIISIHANFVIELAPVFILSLCASVTLRNTLFIGLFNYSQIFWEWLYEWASLD